MQYKSCKQNIEAQESGGEGKGIYFFSYKKFRNQIVIVLCCFFF